jgi:tetratricopeptide (TPR) repeat protein
VKTDEALQAAMRHHQAGQLAAAEKIYREILRQHPDHPDALQMLGILAGQRGDADAAIDLIRRAISANPDYPGAYRNLAPLLAQQHRFDEAIAAYKKFLELRPDVPEIHRDLGAVLKASGRMDEAAASVSRAVQLKPDFADAHNDLGYIFLIQNRPDDAIAAYWKVIALKPEFAGAHNNLGNALSKKRRIAEALAAYRRAAQLEPNSAAAHNGIGNMLRQTGELDQAIAAYLTAIRLKPDFALAYFNLGQAYRSAGRYEEALSAYGHVLKTDADDAEVHANMAVVLAEMRRFDEAMAAHARLAALVPDSPVMHETLGEIMLRQHNAPAAADHFRRSVAIDPNRDSAWNGLGLALQSQGRFDEAAKCFRRVLELCPNAAIGLVYRHLVNTGRIAAGQTDIDRLTASLNEPDIPAVSRVAAGFALGKVLDEVQRFDEAFVRYAEANSLVKQLQTAAGERYDPQIVQRQLEQTIDTFTPEFFRQRRDWTEPSQLPVFIVGMPRSGTTLVQQIAASHPQVHGAGELHDIANILKTLGGTDLKSAALAWNRDAIKTAADRHLQRLRSLNATALRIIDKMPNNIHRLGLISLLFPAARVIFCRREARDTCLSCYFQWFSIGNTFAYDLAHCGHEYIATDRLMDHWRQALPLPMIDLQYEDLVADLEGQSRRLFDFLGVPWDPACLEFHRTETTVLTASSWQVRQPIYRNSLGRWRHYERHLTPLLEVLSSPDRSARPARPEQSD